MNPDTTARAAYEPGYSVRMLSDCCSARFRTEHDVYCEVIGNLSPAFA